MIAPEPKLSKQLKAVAAKVTKPGQAIDWTAVLGMYGLPKKEVARLTKIFQTTDLQQAVPIAQAYVRGTPWYTQTYPGIQSGINAGLFGDEQGYRSYQNDVSQLYRQYHNRPATTAEVAGFVTSGQNPSQIENQLQARAIQGNLTDPLKSLFTTAELKAFANQQAGIDTALGQRVSMEADLAVRVESLYKDFYGRSVNRGELDQLTVEGASAETVAKNFATQANINAMNPAISHLFSPEEIKQIALERAGGITETGQVLNSQATLAAQLNPIYHQYTGAGVSREDVAAAYQSGDSADTIGRRFSGKAFVDANRADIQQTFGNFGGEGQLDEAGLKAFGEQQVGLDSAMGQKLDAAFEKAKRRIQTVSRGVLAQTNLALPASSRRRPDTGA